MRKALIAFFVVFSCLIKGAIQTQPTFSDFEDDVKSSLEGFKDNYRQNFGAFLTEKNISSRCQAQSPNVCSGVDSSIHYGQYPRPSRCVFGEGFIGGNRTGMLLPDDFNSTNDSLTQICISSQMQREYKQIWERYPGLATSVDFTAPSGAIRTFPGKQTGDLCSEGYKTSTPTYVLSTCGQKNVYILVDASESMEGHALDQCIVGIIEAFNLFSKNDRVQVGIMNQYIRSLGGDRMLSGSEQNISRLINSLENITAEGSNDYLKAIDKSLEQMKQSGGCGNNLLMFITNGRHNHGALDFREEFPNILKKYEGFDFQILAIGINQEGSELDYPALEFMTSLTNGSAREVQSFDQIPPQIRKYYRGISSKKKIDQIVKNVHQDPIFGEIITYSSALYYQDDGSDEQLGVASISFSATAIKQKYNITTEQLFENNDICNLNITQSQNTFNNSTQRFKGTGLTLSQFIEDIGTNSYGPFCPENQPLIFGSIFSGIFIFLLIITIMILALRRYHRCCFAQLESQKLDQPPIMKKQSEKSDQQQKQKSIENCSISNIPKKGYFQSSQSHQIVNGPENKQEKPRQQLNHMVEKSISYQSRGKVLQMYSLHSSDQITVYNNRNLEKQEKSEESSSNNIKINPPSLYHFRKSKLSLQRDVIQVIEEPKQKESEQDNQGRNQDQDSQ